MFSNTAAAERTVGSIHTIVSCSVGHCCLHYYGNKTYFRFYCYVTFYWITYRYISIINTTIIMMIIIIIISKSSQCRTCYWFSVAFHHTCRFAQSSDVKFLPFHHCFHFAFSLHFAPCSYFSPFLPPGQYSLTPIVICQLQYMSVPFLSQFDKFQSYVSVSIPFSALCHSFFKTIVVAYILYNKRSITATCFGKSCCHPQGIASKGWIHT